MCLTHRENLVGALLHEHVVHYRGRLTGLITGAGLPLEQPANELLLDAAIEDAARGGIEGTQKLLRRNTGRKMTRSELERANQRADDVGRMGEELIDGYFASLQTAGTIEEYAWVSADNAISPYDFTAGPTHLNALKFHGFSSLRSSFQTDFVRPRTENALENRPNLDA